ncbi:MAG: response regulator [Lachnospiraceae bacterium]
MYKVMIVDDNLTNLATAKKALEDEYEILSITSGARALEVLKNMMEPPHIVLLDLNMPEESSLPVLKELKSNPKLRRIRILLMTEWEDVSQKQESLLTGKVDYIKKPYAGELLREHIDMSAQILSAERKLKRGNEALSEILQKKTHNAAELSQTIVELFSKLMKNRSPLLFEHSQRVEAYMRLYMEEIIRAKQSGISAADARLIVPAARVHDIGKICIPDRCLINSSDLNLQEKKLHHAHTEFGGQAIRKAMEVVPQSPFLSYAYHMCRSHHERWDGEGYPDRLVTNKIPVEARILAIVNSYDSFRNENDGDEPLTHGEAMNRIRLWGGTHFDPQLVDLFLHIEKKIEQIEFL